MDEQELREAAASLRRTARWTRLDLHDTVTACELEAIADQREAEADALARA